MTFRPFWLDQALRSNMRPPARRWPAIPAPTCASSAAATPACGPPSCSRSTIPDSTWCWSRPTSAAPAPAAATAAARCPGRPNSSPWNGCSGSPRRSAWSRPRGQHPGHRRLLPALRRRGRHRLDGTLYTATPAQVGTDSVIAALERHGINSFAKRPLADVQRLAGSRRHLEAGSRRLPRRAARQAGSRPAPGRPATGGYACTKVRRCEDWSTAARRKWSPPTGGSSPTAWCWR